MARRGPRAFTLVELLIVIVIIVLLVAILAPAVGQALEQARRATCSVNTKEIVRACQTYAMTPREHRGCAVTRALPSVHSGAGWESWHLTNRKCLWLLVKYEYASPGTFVCPSLLDFHQAEVTSSKSTFEEDELGYSFYSMATGPVSLDKAYVALAIVADLNPRYEPGEKDPEFEVNHSRLDDRDYWPEINAKAHKTVDEKPIGQNVGRLDGSGAFLRRPVVTTATNTDDCIWDSANDSEGKCGPEDVFLAN